MVGRATKRCSEERGYIYLLYGDFQSACDVFPFSFDLVVSRALLYEWQYGFQPEQFMLVDLSILETLLNRGAAWQRVV